MKRQSISGMRRHAAQMHALAAVRRDIQTSDRASSSKYLRKFNGAFRKYDGPLTPEQLNARLVAADIVLVGDYHALPACQQFAAQLIEQLVDDRPVVLGVEAVLSRDQQVLDSWWCREISEPELRERLRFDHEWGYEWRPFYDLLVTAREHADGIYGLDCMPRHDLRRIRARDRHAAGKIGTMRERHPEARLLVLFGESHMAPEHLPRDLDRAMGAEKRLTVLQNLDPIYWQAAAENAAAVSLSNSAVCVFNSTPLEKYESYRICLEKWHSDDAPDFTPAVHNLILSLARSLGFRANSPHNGTQPKQLADSLPEVVHVSGSDWPGEEQEQAALEQRGCLYVPRSNAFLIRNFQMPAAAHQAARFLYYACRGNSNRDGDQDTLAHFGARLLCPGNVDETHAAGEKLYRAYVDGAVTRAQVRKMFLGKCEPGQGK
jgi:hypothetical protein